MGHAAILLCCVNGWFLCWVELWLVDYKWWNWHNLRNEYTRLWPLKGYTYVYIVFFSLLLPWRIRLFGLLPFRINPEIMKLIDSWSDSLDGGSARRKSTTYTGQHKHIINAGRHPCLEWDSNPQSQCWSGQRHFMSYTARPLWSATVFSN
jgi:hypothetical protein